MDGSELVGELLNIIMKNYSFMLFSCGIVTFSSLIAFLCSNRKEIDDEVSVKILSLEHSVRSMAKVANDLQDKVQKIEDCIVDYD